MKTIRATVDYYGRAELRFGYDKELVELVKSVSGFRWDKPRKVWWGPVHALAALDYAGRQQNVGVAVEWPRQPAALISVGAKQPRPYQMDAIARLLSSPSFVLAWEMRTGKAQSLDAKVLTPIGWRRMGELRAGDQLVHPNGGTSSVTGVFPQGLKPIFRVTTIDGSSTECCAEHLWSVRTHKLKQTTNNLATYPLSRLIEKGVRLKSGRGQYRWFLPLCAPPSFHEAVPRGPIAPYVLGVLLGDGSIAHSSVGFTTMDEDIVERVRSYLPLDVRLTERGPRRSKAGDFFIVGSTRAGGNRVLSELRRLGLMGLRSPEKFIPESYLRLPPEHRLELLRGLMDTDGDTPKGSICVFNSTSFRLCTDVVELVRSLGGFASITVKPKPTFVHKGEKRIGLDCWRAYIRMPTCPFALRRKAEKWKPSTLSRSIVRVEPIGEKQAQCISVSASDGLYVTDDYIVTHNTVCAVTAGASAIATNMVGRVFVLAPANTMHGWEAELRATYPNMPAANIEGVKNVIANTAQSVAKDEKEFRELLKQETALRSASFIFCQHDLMARRGPDLLALAEQGAFAVACDEPQSFVDYKAPRSQMLMSLGQHKNSLRRWAFSGTFMKSAAKDLPVSMEFLACPAPPQDQKKGSQWPFLIRYAGAHEETVGNGSDAKSVMKVSDVETNGEELKARIWSIAHKLTRAEIAPWLPPAERTVILANLTKDAQSRYRALESRLGEKALAAVNGSERQEHLKLLAASVLKPKIDEVVARLRVHTRAGLKITCGMMFHESLDQLGRALFPMNKQYVVVPELDVPVFLAAGWDPPEKRVQATEAWRAYPGSAVLLCSILANSTGIDHADADVQINGELPWVPSDALQWEARLQDVHQGKRKTPPLHEYVLARGTIDEDMALAMLKKMGAIGRIMGTEREMAGLDAALRGSGLVSTVDIGLTDRSDTAVDAALEGLKRRLLGIETVSAADGAGMSNAALAGAVAEAYEDENGGQTDEA